MYDICSCCRYSCIRLVGKWRMVRGKLLRWRTSTFIGGRAARLQQICGRPTSPPSSCLPPPFAITVMSKPCSPPSPPSLMLPLRFAPIGFSIVCSFVTTIGSNVPFIKIKKEQYYIFLITQSVQKLMYYIT